MDRRLVAAVLLAGSLVVSSWSGRARAADAPYEIHAILSLTGPAAFLGSKEAQALAIAERTIDEHGGIGGRPVKFVVDDDATVPQNAVQLADALIAKKVPLIIGPSVVATCSAVLPLVARSGPLTYCLAPPMPSPPGSYMLTEGNTSRDLVLTTFRALRAERWNRVALITSTDASGQSFDRDFDAVLATPDGRGVDVLTREHFNPVDVSIAAQVARIKAAAPQAILSFTVGTPFGTLLRQLNDAGLDVPVFGSGANLNSAQLDAYRAFAPPALYFVGSGGAAPDPYARGAVKAAQNRFFDAFKEAGVRPEFLHNIAWDPAMLYVDLIRKLGTGASAQQLHDAVMSLRGWSGMIGTYDFVAYPQRGVGPSAAILYRWESAKGALSVVPLPNAR